MAIAETVKHYLLDKSVDYQLVAHPHSGSSHETAEASHVREDHIAKAVIVKDAAGAAMVIIPASHWVEMKHLRRELDRTFELVSERELAELFSDCEQGAVPPLGPAYQIETFLDEHLGRRVDHGNRLWQLCNAEIWYRMMIEGCTREELNEQLHTTAVPG